MQYYRQEKQRRCYLSRKNVKSHDDNEDRTNNEDQDKLSEQWETTRQLGSTHAQVVFRVSHRVSRGLASAPLTWQPCRVRTYYYPTRDRLPTRQATDPSAHHLTATHSTTPLLDSLTTSQELSLSPTVDMLCTHTCTYVCTYIFVGILTIVCVRARCGLVGC